MDHGQTKLAVGIAALAQATSLAPAPFEPFAMLVQTAPQLIFGVTVYYMMIKREEKQEKLIESLANKFQSGLDQVMDRSEKRDELFTGEFKAQAQQDREQHGRLFEELVRITREQMAVNSAQKNEFVAFKAQVMSLIEDRRGSVLPAPEASADRPSARARDVDDPRLPRPPGG